MSTAWKVMEVLGIKKKGQEKHMSNLKEHQARDA